MRSVKVLCSLTALFFASACSTFGGSSDDRVVLPESAEAALQRVAALEVELTRLKSENARLSNQVLELQRENEAVGLAENADAPELRDDDGPPLVSVMIPTPQPQANAIVEEAGTPELAKSDVPVAEAPRLVQPSFASTTDAVFENEADSEVAAADMLFGVHLASYRQMAEAQEGWRKLQRENPDELGLLEPRLETVTLPEKGVFLRLIGGGFSSQEKAAALCANLKQKNLFCAVSGFKGQRLSLAEVN